MRSGSRSRNSRHDFCWASTPGRRLTLRHHFAFGLWEPPRQLPLETLARRSARFAVLGVGAAGGAELLQDQAFGRVRRLVGLVVARPTLAAHEHDLHALGATTVAHAVSPLEED